MAEGSKILAEMNDRSKEVFRRVVEGYLSSGDPVGSRTLTRSLSEKLSAATVRNVMQDLEFLGLLDSPHISAGRIPTQMGLRMFVDSLLEVGTVADEDRERIDATAGTNDQELTALLDHIGTALSGIDQVSAFVLQAANNTRFTSPDCHTGYFLVVVFRHDRYDGPGRIGMNLLL